MTTELAKALENAAVKCSRLTEDVERVIADLTPMQQEAIAEAEMERVVGSRIMTGGYYLNVFESDGTVFCEADPILETEADAVDDIINMQGRRFKYIATYTRNGEIDLSERVAEQIDQNEAEKRHERDEISVLRGGLG